MGLIYCIFAAGRGLNESKWPNPTCKPNKPRTRLYSAREMFKTESWREDMTDLADFWRVLAVTLTTNGQRFPRPSHHLMALIIFEWVSRTWDGLRGRLDLMTHVCQTHHWGQKTRKGPVVVEVKIWNINTHTPSASIMSVRNHRHHILSLERIMTRIHHLPHSGKHLTQSEMRDKTAALGTPV